MFAFQSPRCGGKRRPERRNIAAAQPGSGQRREATPSESSAGTALLVAAAAGKWGLRQAKFSRRWVAAWARCRERDVDHGQKAASSHPAGQWQQDVVARRIVHGAACYLEDVVKPGVIRADPDCSLCCVPRRPRFPSASQPAAADPSSALILRYPPNREGRLPYRIPSSSAEPAAAYR